VRVNPMNMTDELRHYVEDSGARTAFVAQDLYERIAPLVGEDDGQLANVIVATYSDYRSIHRTSRLRNSSVRRAMSTTLTTLASHTGAMRSMRALSPVH
jgi:fatty-acyl-CoA synthase